ncbi:MAG: VWA domain-containing protein, partial [Verrucomicrobiota bacterium]
MIFLDSLWLYLTPVIVIAVGGLIVYGMRRRDTLLSHFAASRLLGQLTGKTQTRRLWLKAGFVLIGLALLCLSLARPQYGVEWIERKARGLDIIFVLDSSKSMLATDLRPTRLERAKLAIIDLVERLESDRIGLVAFAGRAFLQTPPTLDYAAFRESLDSIGIQTISSGGSDLGSAITEAANAFPQANNFKVVILLTDGEDLGGKALEVAQKVADDNVKIYAIGLGTPEGKYLRVRNSEDKEEFIRDAEGQPVRSQLDEATLSEIALRTGGSYARLGGDSLNALYSSVIATLPREERESEMQEARIDRYQWPLGLAILFLAADFVIRRRARGQTLAMLALLLLLQPNEAQAQDELAPEIVEAPTEEAPVFESDDARELYNAAHSMIQEGNYQAAKDTLDRSVAQTADFDLQRDSLYNAAHSVFQEGETALQSQDFQAAIEKWKEAEGLFRSAHSIDPEDSAAIEDAALVEARRKALEAFLEQQQEQNQEQDSQDQDQDGDPQDEDSESEQDDQGDQSEQNDQGEQGESESENNQDQNGDSSEQDENQQNQGDQNDDSSDSESGEQGQDQSEEAAQGEDGGSNAEDESSESDQEEQADAPQSGEEEDDVDSNDASAGEPDASEAEPVESSADQAGTTGEAIDGMSPEQAVGIRNARSGGEPNNNIDTRADVYSLGVILYQLLTETTPISETYFGQATKLELLQTIQSQVPELPSVRVGKSSFSASNESTPVSDWAGILRNELDWVTMRALEKERDRRYATVAAFADDVQNYLRHEPVNARPPSLSYRLSKLAQRHRTATIAAAVVLVLVMMSSLGFAWLAAKSKHQAEIAQKAENGRAKAMQLMSQLLENFNPSTNGARFRQAQLKLLDDFRDEMQNDDYSATPRLEAEFRKILGDAYSGSAEYDAAVSQFERVVSIYTQFAETDIRQLVQAKLRLVEEHVSHLAEIRALPIAQDCLVVATERFGERDELTLAARIWENRSSLSVRGIGQII